jgi:soluble lytic murein transglycosylase-like protein
VFTNSPPRGNCDRIVISGPSRPKARRARLPRSLERSVVRHAKRFGVSEKLVRAVIQVESGGNPGAVSPKGAMGIMQLMPETARRLGVADPMNAEENLVGGIRHLGELLERFGGDTALALAAYNAGVGAVERHGGVPPYQETRAYVRKVLRLAGREIRPEDPVGGAAPRPAAPIRRVRQHGGGLLFEN